MKKIVFGLILMSLGIRASDPIQGKKVIQQGLLRIKRSASELENILKKMPTAHDFWQSPKTSSQIRELGYTAQELTILASQDDNATHDAKK